MWTWQRGLMQCLFKDISSWVKANEIVGSNPTVLELFGLTSDIKENVK
jgi:hypothetical protein